MATAVSACESNKNTGKPASPFSKSEIEAAKQLIQLSSSGDEQEEDGDYHHNHSISNNSCSYSVVQGNNNSGGDVVSSAAADDEEKDESCLLPRRNNKRYRFLEDLYSVTVPLIVKSKRKNTSIKTRNS
ncbi:hypothetical protein PIB30_075894 [Stylosanthes scabra]|uniref:Uncharacterized protein n=1 Tax=Stylosanthes scabra TaxID=79078 RepID=A0ABU6QR99_9FABA|nr:hypothetical protein [Stylosanthes scabra]